MSLRKSSSSRNGSKSLVFPKPKARRRCTPAPSRVGLDLMTRFMGRIDMFHSIVESVLSNEFTFSPHPLAFAIYGYGCSVNQLGLVAAKEGDDPCDVLRLGPCREIGLGHGFTVRFRIDDARKYGIHPYTGAL